MRVGCRQDWDDLLMLPVRAEGHLHSSPAQNSMSLGKLPAAALSIHAWWQMALPQPLDAR